MLSESTWARPASRPVIGHDAAQTTDGTGKFRWTPVVSLASKELYDRDFAGVASGGVVVTGVQVVELAADDTFDLFANAFENEPDGVFHAGQIVAVFRFRRVLTQQWPAGIKGVWAVPTEAPVPSIDVLLSIEEGHKEGQGYLLLGRNAAAMDRATDAVVAWLNHAGGRP